ncbi:DUF5065 domain-containing protein [Bacillus cereus]|uniref:DUF5065 family protein n=1 Tax=Bacillus nitratireducens TaxID=2026193 RepID=UPI000B441639|nr:DUF5065 family protein [Bacillus nitratireducens]PDY08481.1 DUF5065 domain-containing protein [Bacillus cereus]PES64951.1 DUF5065 domain-containing protein [Bacillus cereus]PFJ45242.1 DUF5065 domain-containing protein [Bacillus cereus]PFW08761.1 DUF5065 domain-containing protein [Bacillus cereus]PGW92576.1 DUF5065 domain-containing protein [Bacillus cereus]
MKLLKQSTIIGALTVGGFLFSNTISTIPPVSAESQLIQKESQFTDNWRWQSYFLLHHNADFLEELAVGDLKHGDTFDVNIYTGGKDTGIVKIYQLSGNEDDEINLHRYKTIYDSGLKHNYGRFVTPITKVYTPGTYVAVMKLGENYYYGGSFKISK